VGGGERSLRKKTCCRGRGKPLASSKLGKVKELTYTEGGGVQKKGTLEDDLSTGRREKPCTTTRAQREDKGDSKPRSWRAASIFLHHPSTIHRRGTATMGGGTYIDPLPLMSRGKGESPGERGPIMRANQRLAPSRDFRFQKKRVRGQTGGGL